MNLKATLKTGTEVLLENDGQETRVQLKSDNSSSHQSQNSSFQTGKWSQKPQVFESKEGAFLQIEAGQSPIFFALTQNGIGQLETAPDLGNASPLSLQQTDESSATPAMKPMKPMEPMKPLF